MQRPRSVTAAAVGVLFALLAVTHAARWLPGSVELLQLSDSGTGSFEVAGPLRRAVICVMVAHMNANTNGSSDVASQLVFTGSLSGANNGGLQALSFSGYEPLLNTSCLLIDSVPAEAVFVGQVSLVASNHIASDGFPHVVFVNVEMAQSITSALTKTWQNAAGSSGYVEGQLTLLQRKWFYLEKGLPLPLVSFETCDSPVSIEKLNNETSMEDSQFLPRLTVFPYFPGPKLNGTVAWAPGSFDMQTSCAWGATQRVTVDIERKNEAASLPACPSAVLSFANASQHALDDFFMYVSASPVVLTSDAIRALISELNTTAANRTQVGFYLGLRWDELQATSQAVAPLRINNDLLLSFEGPEGIQWPVNTSAVSVYGAVRSTDHFMNSTRDRALLSYMLQSGCFLRTHATRFNATMPLITTDEANRRVNIQLSLFYAFNNNPDTKVTPSFYGYVAVLLQDARFVWVHFKGATLPSESFPGQLPVSQLAQVIIASLSGLLIIVAVMAIAFGVQLKKATKAREDYQIVASLE